MEYIIISWLKLLWIKIQIKMAILFLKEQMFLYGAKGCNILIAFVIDNLGIFYIITGMIGLLCLPFWAYKYEEEYVEESQAAFERYADKSYEEKLVDKAKTAITFQNVDKY